ncbi:Laccase [Coniochaeta hoffmannii]|uniref:Laccase n=1 Tax=Coniochaeta hoffmannii TaxID=91930 RepID=A0AA38VK07_9PEZI|nr:Laccase [Coniochaeta hoffmannii]
MVSTSEYRPIRSESPRGERAGAEEHELEEKPQDSEDGVNPSDRLLPAAELSEDEWQDVPLLGVKLSRRSAWIVFALGVLAMVLTGALVILIRMYMRNRAGDDTPRGFRRPSSEYVLGLDWDYEAPPQVREYYWTIQEIDANPDGIFRPMLTVNGLFPGELIRCNEGDTIVVNVENRGINATAIHFHGIYQNGTNHMDGVPGVTQCAIAPGGRFRYEFTVAGQAGTYFYHAHQATQALDGLMGPLIVHARDEPQTQEMPYASDRVVLVQDWYYDLSSGLLRKKLSPGYEGAPAPDGALINGANKVDCSLYPERQCDSSTAAFASLDLAPNANHRLRVINVGALAWFELTVDEHRSLPIVEIDGTNISPAPESSIIVAPGQRYSVVLSTNQSSSPDSYWLRARMMKHCFGENVAPDEGFQEVKAIVRYSPPTSPSAPLLPSTNPNGNHAVECKDMNTQTTYTPVPPLPAPASADHSYHLRLSVEIGSYRLERGKLNASSYRPDLASPTLHRVLAGLSSGNASYLAPGPNTLAFDPATELVISHSGPEVVDVVLQNFDEGNHPFHLHGHKFFVLGAGHGYFPGYESLGLRPEGKGLLDAGNDTVVANPARRDVATVEGFGWTLIRFVADNPGVWLFHCHLAWHSESGMAMQFVSRLDMLGNWTLPEANARLCEVPVEELTKGAAPEDSVWYDS